MIDHIIHYFYGEFNYTWTLQLSFRLNQGDLLHYELLDKRGNPMHLEDKPNEWGTLCVNYEYFEVEFIQIDHCAKVVAYLRIPKQ